MASFHPQKTLLLPNDHPNPATRLWEFYHLRTAFDPARGETAEDVEVPFHGATEDAVDPRRHRGIVFVLVPGGVATIGSSADEIQSGRHGALENEEPQHRVELAPFFIARHELTRFQCAGSPRRSSSHGSASDCRSPASVGRVLRSYSSERV